MSKLIRRATLRDLDAIVDLAIESVTTVDPLPLKINREAIEDTTRDAITSNAHFVWVTEEDSQIVACVGAVVSQSFWHEKLDCSVLLFYSKKPGTGIGLIREFAKWVKSRPAIKMAMFSLERSADPRIGKLLVRLGFGMQNPQYTYVRGL